MPDEEPIGPIVYAPYCPSINPCVLEVLVQERVDLRPRPCPGDLDYWSVLRELWAQGETAIVVEHDVLPWPGALQHLHDCPEPWCLFPYWTGSLTGMRRLEESLGCTKFSGALMRAHPDAMEVIGSMNVEGYFGVLAPHWRGLDQAVAHVLRERGYSPHIHQPNVTHLNPRIARDGYSAEERLLPVVVPKCG